MLAVPVGVGLHEVGSTLSPSLLGNVANNFCYFDDRNICKRKHISSYEVWLGVLTTGITQVPLVRNIWLCQQHYSLDMASFIVLISSNIADAWTPKNYVLLFYFPGM